MKDETLLYILIPLAMFMNACANVLIKRGAISKRNIFINYYTPTGYLLFICVMITGMKIITLLELKYLSLILAANYLAAFLCGLFFFNERTNVTGIIGICLICFGTAIFFK